MRENGLNARPKRRFKRTTDSYHAFLIAGRNANIGMRCSRTRRQRGAIAGQDEPHLASNSRQQGRREMTKGCPPALILSFPSGAARLARGSPVSRPGQAMANDTKKSAMGKAVRRSLPHRILWTRRAGSFSRKTLARSDA